MRPEIIRWDAVDAGLRAKWCQACDRNPTLGSPYFRPEFVDAAHALCGEPVEVAIWRQGDEVQALWPFVRRGRELRPPAFGMNDYQGPVAFADFVPDPVELLLATGARCMRFDHLYPIDERRHAPFVLRSWASPQLDVRGGIEAYKSRLGKTGRSELAATQRKGRKMGREIGALRFEFDDRDPALMDTLVAWKRRQYRATGAPDAFAVPWRRQLLERLLRHRDASFRGVLSALYAGERVVALHYYLQAGPVLHSWFPAYDEELARYSPGRVLLAMSIEQADAQGVALIDLGKGEVTYKLRAMTGSVRVGEGVFDRWRWRAALRRASAAMFDRIRASRP